MSIYSYDVQICGKAPQASTVNDPDASLTVTVWDLTGLDLDFEVKRSTTFGELRKLYADYVDAHLHTVHFMIDGCDPEYSDPIVSMEVMLQEHRIYVLDEMKYINRRG